MSAPLPPFLNRGDSVRIVATARPVTEAEISPATQALELAGLVPVLDESLFTLTGTPVGPLAGDDPTRMAALQRAFEDRESKAILFARGGYGTARLLSGVDGSVFQARHRWLIGYSDLTALLLAAYRHGSASVHGPMARWSHPPTQAEDFKALVALLMGQPPTLVWQSDGHSPTNTTAPLVAANLALLVASIGTPWQPNLQGCILLLEETGEYAYRIDRMLLQLQQARLLEGVVAVVFGDCSHNHPDEDFSADQLHALANERLASLEVPVLFGAPVGHKENKPVVVGGRYTLQAGGGTASLTFAPLNP